MNPILKNVLAFIGGWLLGGMVNMGTIILGNKILPPPDGVNPMDPASIQANIHLYESSDFIVPFLAHALGALVGALVAAKLAASHHMKLALGVGAFFLLGGIMMIVQIGGPTWYVLLDLIVAYIPMAWLGGKMGVPKIA